jgi:hypothetical protein
MDSSILQLFAVEEILERIEQQKLTGCFHAFAPKESANLFFQDGAIIAAVKGKTEGGKTDGAAILRQILTWKGARYFWEPNALPPIPPGQPLQIRIGEFIAQNKAGAEMPAQAPPPPLRKANAPVIAITAKGPSTGPLMPAPATPRALDNTTTMNMASTPETRAAQEDALLKRFSFTLVSVAAPEQRFKITRVSSVLGRNSACDIPISHPSISRQHCLIQVTPRGLHVKDLGTTNGTKVNGIVLHEGYINAGDKLTFGHLAFMVEKE